MHRPPPLRSAVHGPALVLLGLCLLALPSLAGDRRPVRLPLASGKAVDGVVESADAKEVVVRVGPEEVRRIPWSQLATLGVYRVKAALAPVADGQARLVLAELAVELGLHAEARLEYEKALALGAMDPKTFATVVARAERDAVKAGVKQALRAADQGEWEQALQVARNLKLHFGGAPNAAAVDRLIAEILQRVRSLQDETDKAARQLERMELGAPRKKEILERRMRAIGDTETGRKEAKKAAAAREKGNVTRARKHAEAADEAFMRARRHLGRLRRIIARGEPAYREILALLNELDRDHFGVLLDTAWFFWDQTVYSRADEYAARASYIDPVHPDLLELRDLLRVARIRYRLSDVTNARPIIR